MRPKNLTTVEEDRCKAIDDLGLAVESLRRAVTSKTRACIHAMCDYVECCMTTSTIDGDDEDEITAVLALIKYRVQFGVYERLRQMLLPLVDAIHSMIERAEENCERH